MRAKLSKPVSERKRNSGMYLSWRSAGDIAYVAQFLGGVARSAGDEGLRMAAEALDAARGTGSPEPALARLAALIDDRLAVPAPI